MEYFRFVPPTLLVISTVVVAMPNPQVAFTSGLGGSAPAPTAPAPAPAAPSGAPAAPANTRFLGFNSAPAAPAPAPAAPAPAPLAPSGAPAAPANTRFLGFNSAPTQRPQQQQVFGGFGPFIPAVN